MSSNIPENPKIKKNMAGVKKKFMVFSGKGGVGKTTVAVNLAYTLKAKKKKVGILDIDIHGPNVIKMMGLENMRLQGDENNIRPLKAFDDLKVVSTASIMENDDTPVIWRGPLKMKLITQFLSDVEWGQLDYLIIDAPPGTGDEPLSIAQLLPDLTGGIIVTTPQEVSLLDARKSIRFAQQVNIPYLGIVENMSGLVCPYCHKRIDLFKTGGGERLAKETGLEFLGRIPINVELMQLGDKGEIYTRKYKNNTDVSEAYKHIANKIMEV